MLKRNLKLLASTAVFLIAASVSAQEPLKIGMVLEMSGPFADFGMQMINGAHAYMKVHGDTVAGRKGTCRQRQGRLPRRLRAHAERACGCAACNRGEEADDRDERRNVDHHHAFALYRPRVVHAAAGHRAD